MIEIQIVPSDIRRNVRYVFLDRRRVMTAILILTVVLAAIIGREFPYETLTLLGDRDDDRLLQQIKNEFASDRGMLDLLSVTSTTSPQAGRLAVLELKADDDLHLALQGLDYWIRVPWHHLQTADSATRTRSECQTGSWLAHTCPGTPAPFS